MPDKKPIPVNIDPNLYALTGVNVRFDEEQFFFQLTSGNQIRGYLASPKHAKRVMLLLDKQVKEYENKFGDLKTDLPKVKKATDKKMGF